MKWRKNQQQQKNEFPIFLKRGEVEEVEGKSEATKKTKFLSYNDLAHAFYQAEEWGKAIDNYQKITSLTTGRLFTGDIYVKSFYMLGKIYQEQGNKSKSIEYYEEFLNFWKNADPGLVEVKDARIRLASIKGSQ